MQFKTMGNGDYQVGIRDLRALGKWIMEHFYSIKPNGLSNIIIGVRS